MPAPINGAKPPILAAIIPIIQNKGIVENTPIARVARSRWRSSGFGATGAVEVGTTRGFNLISMAFAIVVLNALNFAISVSSLVFCSKYSISINNTPYLPASPAGTDNASRIINIPECSFFFAHSVALDIALLESFSL